MNKKEEFMYWIIYETDIGNHIDEIKLLNENSLIIAKGSIAIECFIRYPNSKSFDVHINVFSHNGLLHGRTYLPAEKTVIYKNIIGYLKPKE